MRSTIQKGMWAMLAIAAAIVLGATAFREQVATAASAAQQALIVREQNLDANGNIKVHEQGTANVNVTNGTLAVREQGTVSVSGTVSGRPAAPASPWYGWVLMGGGSGIGTLEGPSEVPINVTSISVSSVGTAHVSLSVHTVPASATSCLASDFLKQVWNASGVHDPFAVAFPTPLQVAVPAGTKICLRAAIESAPGELTELNASGFLGS